MKRLYPLCIRPNDAGLFKFSHIVEVIGVDERDGACVRTAQLAQGRSGQSETTIALFFHFDAVSIVGRTSSKARPYDVHASAPVQEESN
jgi:metal-dependent amidase/aminoacylase/carboxypeptidase family protein